MGDTVQVKVIYIKGTRTVKHAAYFDKKTMNNYIK